MSHLQAGAVTIAVCVLAVVALVRLVLWHR
jgi:hypothetical protein